MDNNSFASVLYPCTLGGTCEQSVQINFPLTKKKSNKNRFTFMNYIYQIIQVIQVERERERESTGFRCLLKD